MQWVGSTKISENSAEEAALTYVTVMESQPNAWGRNLHPVYGDSANVLHLMECAFGPDFQKAVAKLFEERKALRALEENASAGPRM